MRDYRQSPSFWPFTADWFWSVKFVSPFKSIKPIQWDSFNGRVKSLGFDFSLSPLRLALLAWGDFHALAFRSLHYPWGKMETSRSLLSIHIEWFSFKRCGLFYNDCNIRKIGALNLLKGAKSHHLPSFYITCLCIIWILKIMGEFCYLILYLSIETVSWDVCCYGW